MTDKSLSEKRREAGRKGGKSTSVKGTRKLSPERRSEIASIAAKALWAQRRLKKLKDVK